MRLRGEKRGSALIMVMLVVAGITTIIFSTQRIALVQFSQSVREEDNLAAYYAAKAGIEDGLARYRFDRNTQTTPDKKFRFNLTKATYPPSVENFEIDSDTGIEDGINDDYDPNYQYYDSVINFKTTSINVNDGIFDFSGSNDRLEKDSVINLTGFSQTTSVYYLRYGFRFASTCDPADLDKAFVSLQQIKISSDGSNIVSQDIAAYANPTVSDYIYDSAAIANMQINNPGNSTVSSIRVRAYYCNVEFAFVTTTGITDTGDSRTIGPEFDGLTTEILSTGYFGSAKRTLIAQVNRQTGGLIGIFDFILYSGGNTGTIRRGF
ncbi:MAG: hypothetical protein WEC81_01090 [Patescibacteria group bacterium]